MAGKPQELVLRRRGTDVSATVGEQQLSFNAHGPPSTQGCLRFYVRDGTLRILSIEYRELPPAVTDRPWKPIFDGKTLDAISPLGGTWRVENGAIVNAPGVAKCQTKLQFGDGELRLQFEVMNCAYLEILPTNSPSCLEAILRGPQLEGMAGKRQELLLTRRGAEVSATVNRQPLSFRLLGNPFSQGHLRLFVGSGSLRACVKSHCNGGK
jgi:hypothetical protein